VLRTRYTNHKAAQCAGPSGILLLLRLRDLFGVAMIQYKPELAGQACVSWHMQLYADRATVKDPDDA
jgi:hypothetical protein